jgi:hypothetical protein
MLPMKSRRFKVKIMEAKKMLLSTLSFVLSLVLFVASVFAWFSTTNESAVQTQSIQVTSGTFEDYDMYFYTAKRVYKFQSIDETIYTYDETLMSWVLPAYEEPEEQGFAFSGIIMSQYDPLIEQNNIDNNIVVEIRVNHDSIDNENAILSLKSNIGIASEAIVEFAPETAYYLSRFVFIQQFITDDYASRSEGTNLFSTLTDRFEETDINDDPIYPLLDFYDENDAFQSRLPLANVQFGSETQETWLYFNISYYEQKIEDTFFSGLTEPTLDNIETIRFFQDLVFHFDFEE